VNLYAVSQNKCPLELPGGYAAMKKMPVTLFFLLAANDQLIVFDQHIELVPCKTGNSKRDAQKIALGLFAPACEAFDIVRGISIARAFCNPLKRTLYFFETKQKRRIQE